MKQNIKKDFCLCLFFFNYFTLRFKHENYLYIMVILKFGEFNNLMNLKVFDNIKFTIINVLKF